MSLTKEQLVSKAKPSYKTVNIPGLGDINLIKLSFSQIVEHDKRNENKEPNPGTRLVALSLVDGAGVRMFSDDDIEVLNSFDYAILTKILDEIHALHKLDNDTIEELAKN